LILVLNIILVHLKSIYYNLFIFLYVYTKILFMYTGKCDSFIRLFVHSFVPSLISYSNTTTPTTPTMAPNMVLIDAPAEVPPYTPGPSSAAPSSSAERLNSEVPAADAS
jgi:hypothetical protein